MSKEIRVIKYDPKSNTATEETVGNYRYYYALLECRTFDIVSTKDYDIYVDDEGMMRTGNLVTLPKGSPSPLAGILVFTGKADSEGYTLTLPAEFTTEYIETMCVPYGITQ